jgi:hypothetical protein
MADQPTQRPVFRYEDAPALGETFADAVGAWHFDGHTLRIDFLVSRLDEPKANAPRGGRRRPVCRLVLSAPGAIELLDQCQRLTAALERAGLVKRKSGGAADKPDDDKPAARAARNAPKRRTTRRPH